MISTPPVMIMNASKNLPILVVEDNALVRMHLDLMIRGIPGLRSVGEAADVDEARQLFHEQRPAIVILDLNLPSGNGLDVLRDIRAVDPGCRVIMFSGTMTEWEAEACRQAGADLCLNKALHIDLLQETLETWASPAEGRSTA